jgi:hypothetical protein
VEEPFLAKERRGRDWRDVVPIGSEAPFSSIDGCPLEIPRLVAPLVAPVRPRVGVKGQRATRDLSVRRGTGPIDLLGHQRGALRATETSDLLATAPNDALIVPAVTRVAPHGRLEPTDASRRGTEALLESAHLVATTVMTSTPVDLEVTLRVVHDPRAPDATERRRVRRDPRVATTATPAEREAIVHRDPVRAQRVRHARLAVMTATVTRGLPGPVRSRRRDDRPDRSAVTTESRATAVRVSRLAGLDPTPATDRATRERVVVGPSDVPVN